MSEVVESEQLKQIISKIEHIEEERQEISDQLKDTYNEAKALGFDDEQLGRKQPSFRTF